ncbi:MAG: quinolinate synthase NadA [Archaeoglobaceae archaeon]
MNFNDNRNLNDQIKKLKEEKNAVILAHNYQVLEIQEIADFTGDSLELSRMATETEADIIVFCGVDFMAETASILNPDKKVLIPSKKAICPMAAQLTPDMIIEAKKSKHIPFITYVNSSAECKAEADICCTSSNAAQIVKSLDHEEAFMGPDVNLAWFAEKQSGKKVTPVPADGYCYVHRAFGEEDIKRARETYPQAEIMVHPECNPEVQLLADYIGSTSQMVKRAETSEAEQIIVGTEIGLIDRMKRDLPEKEFIPLKEVVCEEMKMNNLNKILDALKTEEFEVKVPQETAERAIKSVKRMLDVI